MQTQEMVRSFAMIKLIQEEMNLETVGTHQQILLLVQQGRKDNCSNT